MKKYTKIHKLSDNRFLNLFKLDALTAGVLLTISLCREERRRTSSC